MSLLSWSSWFWRNTDGALGLDRDSGADLRFESDFLEAVSIAIKDLVAAFDTQVKAHSKVHGITKIADVSRSRFEVISRSFPLISSIGELAPISAVVFIPPCARPFCSCSPGRSVLGSLCFRVGVSRWSPRY